MTAPPRRVLLGLIDAGIKRSLMPTMHDQEGDARGLRCLYQTIDFDTLGKTADDVPALLDAAEAMGFSA